MRFCRLGRELLLTAAGYPTMIAVAEHLERHNRGDIEATLWLREHAPRSKTVIEMNTLPPGCLLADIDSVATCSECGSEVQPADPREQDPICPKCQHKLDAGDDYEN